MKAPVPANEEARLRRLRSLRVLDTLPERAYNDIVEAASALMDVPMALITLVDEDRQWFKAKVGVEVCETSRDIAFCAHTIVQTEPLVVPDALLDPRFRENPLVTGELGLRFYAGAPIVVEGEAVGSLCCADFVPRAVSDRQVSALAALARQVSELLMAQKRGAEFEESERRFVAFLDNAPAIAFLKDHEGRLRFSNRRHNEMFGRGRGSMLGTRDEDRMPEEFARELRRHDEAVRESLTPIVRDETVPLPDGSPSVWQVVKFPIEINGEAWIGGVALEVTAQRTAEATVQLQAAELTQALQEAETAKSSAQVAAIRFSQLFEGLPIACFTYGEGGTIHEWNEAASELWGIRPEDALLSSIYDTVVGPEHRARKEEIVRRVFAGETVEGQERCEKMRDGREVWLLTSTFPLRTPEGNIVGAVSANVDVTERKRMEEAVRTSESRLRAVLDSLHEGVVVQDATGRVNLCNPSAERILGIPAERMNLRSEDDPRKHALREDGSDFPIEERPFAVAIRENRRAEACLSYQHPDLGTRWLRLTATPVPGWNGGYPEVAVVSFMDVTEARRAEETLRESENRFRTVVESLHEGLIVHDREEGIVLWNASAERLLGYSDDGLRGLRTSDWEMVRPDGAEFPIEDRPVIRALTTGEPQEPTLMGLRRPDGEVRWLNSNVAPLALAEGGKPRAVVASFLDVTERWEQEQRIATQMEQIQQYSVELEVQKHELECANTQLQALATTDGLTGLKNHRYFQEFLRRRIAQSHSVGLPLSVVLLDVDHFKSYNDDFGHQQGDAVLRQVAQVLQNSARGQDLIARYGGEEFVIVMPGTTSEAATSAAERIRQALESQDFLCREVTASFGVASFGPLLSEAEALVRAADEALYRSKEMGRNRVTVWNSPSLVG